MAVSMTEEATEYTEKPDKRRQAHIYFLMSLELWLLESTMSNTQGQHQLTGLYEVPIPVPGLPHTNWGWYRATRKCGLAQKGAVPTKPSTEEPGT